MSDENDARRDETIFTWGSPPLKFGAGAIDEIGFELTQYAVRTALIITDVHVRELGVPDRVAQSLAGYDIRSQIFDGARVEPTDVSMALAVNYARSEGPWDALIAVGGGSAIDTARIAIRVGGTQTPAWARWQVLPLRHMLVVLLITAVESGFTPWAAAVDAQNSRARARVEQSEVFIGAEVIGGSSPMLQMRKRWRRMDEERG